MGTIHVQRYALHSVHADTGIRRREIEQRRATIHQTIAGRQQADGDISGRSGHHVVSTDP